MFQEKKKVIVGRKEEGTLFPEQKNCHERSSESSMQSIALKYGQENTEYFLD